MPPDVLLKIYEKYPGPRGELMEANAKIRIALQEAMKKIIDHSCSDPTCASKVMAQYFRAMAAVNTAEDIALD